MATSSPSTAAIALRTWLDRFGYRHARLLPPKSLATSFTSASSRPEELADMAIEAPTGQKFAARMERAVSADASVIWLQDEESGEKWFCNVQHAFVHGFCQTVDPFASMPHCVLGIVQDAWNATRQRDCRCKLYVKNPYYMELEVAVSMDEKTSSWLFPLTPADPSAIQKRERVQALAA